jgi:glycosyltransferase involved in cell wall biosynthesis
MASSLNILALSWRCTRHPQAGGSELNLFEQARRWAEAGNGVTVFCADPGRQYAPSRDETHDGIEVRRRGGRFTVYLHGAIFLLRNSQNFDRVLDVWNGIPFFAVLFSSKPVVLLVHHIHDRQWFMEFPRLLAAFGRFVERRVAPFLHRRVPVITVSRTSAEALVGIGMERSQIYIVHNGVNRTEWSPEGEHPLGHSIAYVGRLKQYKRLDRLIRAVANLRREIPDVHLNIAGQGDARTEIEMLIDELGLKHHVTMHGFVDEETKERILRTASVFAMPSMQEGWGLSVLEANSRGCPAVAYDVPGLNAAIRNNETGVLARDDDSFQCALAVLLQDPTTRERYSIAARAWAEQFSWESCAKQTLEILYRGTSPQPSITEKGTIDGLIGRVEPPMSASAELGATETTAYEKEAGYSIVPEPDALLKSKSHARVRA